MNFDLLDICIIFILFHSSFIYQRYFKKNAIFKKIFKVTEFDHVNKNYHENSTLSNSVLQEKNEKEK